MDILIHQGTVVTAEKTFDSDILLSNGKIAQIGQDLACPENAMIIEAKGKYVFPEE